MRVPCDGRRSAIQLRRDLSGRGRLFAACAVSLCFLSLAAGAKPALQDEGPTRKLWDTAFVGARRKHPPSKRAPGRRRYRVTTPDIPTDGVAGQTVIGVTVWRLRPATPARGGERLLVHDSGGATEWTPERVTSVSKLYEGDHLRLSVEAARAGYLYVINREQYADGTSSAPYLIFPTNRTLAGRNEVGVGRIIEIPARDDTPPFFTLRRSRAGQIGETLIVLITPAPLEGVRIGDAAQELSGEEVALWEKSWGSQVGRLELESGAAQAWTKEEKEAGADRTRTLTAAAPLPQALFYSPRAKLLDPLLVKVQLRYGDSAPVPRPRKSGR